MAAARIFPPRRSKRALKLLKSDRSGPLPEDERTTLLLRNLAHAEKQRWRTMEGGKGPRRETWLGRVVARVRVVLSFF
jgi:hypothetical protein